MNEVTLTLDNEVLKELIMETIKEKMGIKLWCDGKFMTVNLMLDEELIDTHTVSLDGNVCFYQ